MLHMALAELCRRQGQHQRGEMTEWTRISNLTSEHFQNDMANAANTQKQLVVMAAAGVLQIEKGEEIETGVNAIVQETVVALVNDLMLSETAEAFFGCSVPVNRDEDIGLLSYRVWQLLVRTRRGRETIHVCARNEEDAGESFDAMRSTLEEQDVDSFDALCTILQKQILEGAQVDFFEKCVRNLQPGNGRHTSLNMPIISKTEKRRILSAIDEQLLHWRVL